MSAMSQAGVQVPMNEGKLAGGRLKAHRRLPAKFARGTRFVVGQLLPMVKFRVVRSECTGCPSAIAPDRNQEIVNPRA
jgi:hypothetical protein